MARASGILLHPTALPGPYGIGDLGPAADRFVDTLAAAGQAYWQILPLGPTGYGDSPYQTFSAFAGNPMLISPRLLVDDGLLPPDALDAAPSFPAERVDYGAVIPYKRGLLAQAFAQYRDHGAPDLRQAVDAFAATHHAWLAPFALFMALKDAHDGRPWTEWEPDIAAREPDALARWGAQLAEQVQGHVYSQYLFFRQWERLKGYAAAKGIRIIGDAPIFVAHDSADCWARRELFYIEPDGQPSLIAGVPPDYFSATGQRWGNPLYRWDALAAEGYQWWIDRLRTVLSTVDVLRLDHFRGFAGYWAIPGEAPTAETGRWETGPGAPFFTAVEQALGALADHRRGSGGHHARRGGAARPLRLPRHARAAVRLRRLRGRPGQSPPAAQPRTQRRRLHRDARQRHDGGLVRHGRARRSGVRAGLCPFVGGRPSDRDVGSGAAGLRLGGAHGGGSAAGSAGAGE